MSKNVATETLSREAMSALMSTGNNRQGAVPQVARTDARIWGELETTGMVGPGGGLTRKGSVTRQREVDRLMDELFPL